MVLYYLVVLVFSIFREAVDGGGNDDDDCFIVNFLYILYIFFSIFVVVVAAAETKSPKHNARGVKVCKQKKIKSDFYLFSR
jgi:hypothetical protein